MAILSRSPHMRYCCQEPLHAENAYLYLLHYYDNRGKKIFRA